MPSKPVPSASSGRPKSAKKDTAPRRASAVQAQGEKKNDTVDEASRESFPASDPPATQGGREPSPKAERADAERMIDIVEEAGKQSFPASDPPSWTL